MCLNNISGPTSDRIRKEIIRTFKESFELKITITPNLTSVNFLDVTFNLSSSSYQPYNKPNDHPVYIHIKSNHPPNISKALPDNISKRINNISSSKELFDNAAPLYNNALRSSGYTQTIAYNDTPAITSANRRKRSIIWFNPPYSLNVTSSIAKTFLRLIDKHFPRTHRLHKIFNRNNVKVSYSCLPNFASVITSHNKKVLSTKKDDVNQSCNCRVKDACPLNGNCLTNSVIYNCNVKDNDNDTSVNYIGLTEHTFKDRFYKHRNAFKYKSKANTTELSNYIWNCKESNKDNLIMTWSILDRAKPY